MLILMGNIHTDPLDVDAFARDVEAIRLSTEAEEGCQFYGIILDHRPTGRFVVAERWQDREALTAHLSRAETVAFLKTWGARIKSDLQTYEVVAEVPRSG
ncbi:antibiotic biosynthesis monooxygenase [Rhodospirillaceae bacterium KN72]|uniref:Antibiotic biosynthesis monooxygenase n=1 Tax=Pacificispira spongiicola TaxID=2729598 RepID=A0A7Y0E2P0_9PROT|nr:antibiotic biosynthesis monooxygenase [Pacificispira spongiicola]NMM46109.1 antibiotic biosynthesis monooxygenase [Pacificispira spongiicola]